MTNTERINEAIRLYQLADPLGGKDRDDAIENLHRVVRDVKRQEDEARWKAFLDRHRQVAP